MKKILPGILILVTVAVMVLTALAISADNAAPVIKGTLSTNKAEYARGEKVTLTAALTENDGFGALVLGFSEFPEQLTRTSVEEGVTVGVEKNGTVASGFLAGTNLVFDAEGASTTTSTGTLFTGTYSIPKDLPAGTYTITMKILFAARDTGSGNEFNEAEATNVDFATVSFTVTDQVVTYTPGDLNEDSVVDINDVVYLLYYTVFGETNYPLNQNCDFTHDSAVDINDVVYILYYTVFGETNYPLA